MIFKQALKELLDSRKLIGPSESFQAYLDRVGMSSSRTAQHISIDSLAKLDKELRAENVMVFRLGSPPGERHTHFALARATNGPSDYFLIDQDILVNTPVERFEPDKHSKNLFAFKILPELTETSLVNLAIASGLLPYALGLPGQQQGLIPATGQSTFDFFFQPHQAEETILHHQSGQVEIDALFVAKRDGKDTLFVVEAKSGTSMGSLAKHKLHYPLLSLIPRVPKEMGVIPVYLRTIRKRDHIEFNIAECSIPRKGNHLGALSELKPASISRFAIYGYQN
jgi:Domain of unknown function (DUF6997)